MNPPIPPPTPSPLPSEGAMKLLNRIALAQAAVKVGTQEERDAYCCREIDGFRQSAVAEATKEFEAREAALVEDKARLDWLEQQAIYMAKPFYHHSNVGAYHSIRHSIDSHRHAAVGNKGGAI